ncbi:hypothetical protein C8Q78DRAFT_1030209 [Trametes maxima]|nr:hypothetical protein C8Q78DRAFT_1030209 [Trametes maxima]
MGYDSTFSGFSRAREGVTVAQRYIARAYSAVVCTASLPDTALLRRIFKSTTRRPNPHVTCPSSTIRTPSNDSITLPLLNHSRLGLVTLKRSVSLRTLRQHRPSSFTLPLPPLMTVQFPLVLEVTYALRSSSPQVPVPPTLP